MAQTRDAMSEGDVQEKETLHNGGFDLGGRARVSGIHGPGSPNVAASGREPVTPSHLLGSLDVRPPRQSYPRPITSPAFSATIVAI